MVIIKKKTRCVLCVCVECVLCVFIEIIWDALACHYLVPSCLPVARGVKQLEKSNCEPNDGLNSRGYMFTGSC